MYFYFKTLYTLDTNESAAGSASGSLFLSFVGGGVAVYLAGDRPRSVRLMVAVTPITRTLCCWWGGQKEGRVCWWECRGAGLCVEKSVGVRRRNQRRVYWLHSSLIVYALYVYTLHLINVYTVKHESVAYVFITLCGEGKPIVLFFLGEGTLEMKRDEVKGRVVGTVEGKGGNEWRDMGNENGWNRWKEGCVEKE